MVSEKSTVDHVHFNKPLPNTTWQLALQFETSQDTLNQQQTV